MAYATVANVASEFKDIAFNSTGSAISDTEVGVFLDQASAVIDGIIGSRYLTPVTGTASLFILQQICVWLVKDRVNSILSVKKPQEKTNQEPDGPSLYKRAMDLLAKIKAGTLVLPDADRADTTGGMSSANMDDDLPVFDFDVAKTGLDW